MSFLVSVRTAMISPPAYIAIAESSWDAWDAAAAAQGDTPCAITVTPVGVQ